MSLILDEHRSYLADRVKLDAYERAIARTVRPGSIVLDLASGTGILGLLACRAGAARVYSIEQTGLAGLARDIAAANGYSDRIRVVREYSLRAEIPERVDCIITDQIGHFGFEAGLFEYLDDACTRWLRPGGTTVPRRLQLWVAPVEDHEIRQRIDFWQSAPAGVDVSPARSIAVSSGYPKTIESAQLLGSGVVLADLQLPRTAHEWIDGQVEVPVVRSGALDGLVGWFVAELAPGVTMTNGPGAFKRVGRRNVVLPLATPIDVQAGDLVDATLRIRSSDKIVNWHVVIRRPDGTKIDAGLSTTFSGFLISCEDLQRTAPRSTPRLTRAGEARRRLLLLIDGTHTVESIERQLQQEFADLLPTPERAAQFVAEVLTGYAQ